MKKTIKTLAIVTIVAVGIGGAITVFAKSSRVPEGRGMGPGREGFQGRNFERGGFHESGQLHALFSELNLSEEQKQQIIAIFVKHRMDNINMRQNFLDNHKDLADMLMKEDFDEAKVREMYQAQAVEREKMREDAFVERARMFAEIKAVLTPEQVETLQQKGLDMFENRFEKPGREWGNAKRGFGGRDRFPQIAAKLNLSDEQKQELIAIFSKYQANRLNTGRNFLETHKELADMLLTEEFDEQKVRDLYQQRSDKQETMFVERAKMLSEMKAVLTPEQLETLKQEGSDWFEKAENWFGKSDDRRPMGRDRF